MSAFMVSANHIAAIVGSAQFWGRRSGAGPFQNGLEAAKVLVAENEKSLEARYGGPSSGQVPTEEMIQKWRRIPLQPAALMKAIHCYEYQACETKEFPQSTAAELCQLALKIAACGLPEYEAATWGIAP